MDEEKAPCCGGSLGNLKILAKEREIVRNLAIEDYLKYNPKILVTACPLCKKTFARNRNLKVEDISEIVCKSITSKNINIPSDTIKKYVVLEKNNILV